MLSTNGRERKFAILRTIVKDVLAALIVNGMENRLKGSKEDIVDKKMMEVFELKVMLGQDKEAVKIKYLLSSFNCESSRFILFKPEMLEFSNIKRTKLKCFSTPKVMTSTGPRVTLKSKGVSLKGNGSKLVRFAKMVSTVTSRIVFDEVPVIKTKSPKINEQITNIFIFMF